jgi:hypothetical protein
VRESGDLGGYLEGMYRLNEKILADQKKQVLHAVMTDVIAVLATALLLYPLLRGLLQHATKLSQLLLDSNLSLIRSLGNAAAKRDPTTARITTGSRSMPWPWLKAYIGRNSKSPL